MDERERKAGTLKFGLLVMRLMDVLPIKNSPELLRRYLELAFKLSFGNQA